MAFSLAASLFHHSSVSLFALISKPEQRVAKFSASIDYEQPALATKLIVTSGSFISLQHLWIFFSLITITEN